MRAFKELSSFLEKQILAIQSQWNEALGEQSSDLEQLQARYLELLDLKTDLDQFREKLMAIGETVETPVVKKAKPAKKTASKAKTKKAPAAKKSKSKGPKRANAYPKGTVFQANYKKTPINVIVTADKTLDYKGKTFKSMRELSMYLNNGVPSYLASLKNWNILPPGKAPAIVETPKKAKKAAPAKKKKQAVKKAAPKAKKAEKKAALATPVKDKVPEKKVSTPNPQKADNKATETGQEPKK